MGFLLWGMKMLIAMGFDFVDFTFGQVPGIGYIVDIIGTILSLALWGTPGLIQGWEILIGSPPLPLDFDGFVPTVTLIGLFKMGEISD